MGPTSGWTWSKEFGTVRGGGTYLDQIKRYEKIRLIFRYYRSDLRGGFNLFLTLSLSDTPYIRENFLSTWYKTTSNTCG